MQDPKKPCKGILKTSRSFDRPEPSASYRKSAKFDEMNVLETYHPADKDYGHMKIEEPKTPFNYDRPDDEPQDQLDANLLAEKLRIAADTQTPSFGDDDISDEDFPETAEEKVKRLEFESRRKAHYNEYEAVLLARQLIKEELGEDDDEDDYNEASSSINDKECELSHATESAIEESASSRRNIVEEAPEELELEHEDSSTTKSMDVDQYHPSHPCYRPPQ